MSQKSSKKKTLHLYWCSTEDHSEDWFIVHHSALQARRWLMESEGYEPGDVEAELIMTLPSSLQNITERLIGYPSDETLSACGGILEKPVDEFGARKVTIDKRTFYEGALQSQIDRNLHALGEKLD